MNGLWFPIREHHHPMMSLIRWLVRLVGITDDQNPFGTSHIAATYIRNGLPPLDNPTTAPPPILNSKWLLRTYNSALEYISKRCPNYCAYPLTQEPEHLSGTLCHLIGDGGGGGRRHEPSPSAVDSTRRSRAQQQQFQHHHNSRSGDTRHILPQPQVEEHHHHHHPQQRKQQKKKSGGGESGKPQRTAPPAAASSFCDSSFCLPEIGVAIEKLVSQ